MSLPNSCTEESSSQRSGCSAESPILIVASPASSDSAGGEESSSQGGSGVSADAPISVASPASSASSCGTLSVHGTEELETNPGLDPSNSCSSQVVGGTATIPSAEDEDRVRALMAKYEKVMSGDGVGTRYASSDTLTNEGGRSASLPGSRDHDDRIDNKPTKPGAPQRKPTSRGSRRDKKGPSGARSRVQKKSASVSRRQAYTFKRLGGAGRAASGAVEYEVYWAPTWLPIDYLEGDGAFQEVKDLVVDLFGSETWHTEAQKLGLCL